MIRGNPTRYLLPPLVVHGRRSWSNGWHRRSFQTCRASRTPTCLMCCSRASCGRGNRLWRTGRIGMRNSRQGERKAMDCLGKKSNAVTSQAALIPSSIFHHPVDLHLALCLDHSLPPRARNSSTSSTGPKLRAKEIGVQPPHRTDGSAPAMRSARAHSTCPSWDATKRGVLPLLAAWFTAAPARINSRTHSTWPSFDAMYNGVTPSRRTGSRAAPASNRARMHSTWPRWAAMNTGVAPPSFA